MHYAADVVPAFLQPTAVLGVIYSIVWWHSSCRISTADFSFGGRRGFLPRGWWRRLVWSFLIVSFSGLLYAPSPYYLDEGGYVVRAFFTVKSVELFRLFVAGAVLYWWNSEKSVADSWKEEHIWCLVPGQFKCRKAYSASQHGATSMHPNSLLFICCLALQ